MEKRPDWEEWVKRKLVNSRKGMAGTGDTFGRIAAGEAMRKVITLEPGDFSIRNFISEEIQRYMSAPINYDLWYLNNLYNMLMLDDPPVDCIPPDYLADELDFFETAGQVKPKCFIRNVEDLVPPDFLNDVPISVQWLALREYFIHLMPFETVLYGNWVQLQTEMDFPHHPDMKDYCAYIAIPGGQLGVMEVEAIFKQTDTEGAGYAPDPPPILDSSCEYFFPPANADTGNNICMGEHFMESAYVVPDAKRANVERLAKPVIPESHYPIHPKKPQFWMRYWIHKDEKFPTPGEFVGVLCKSLALPPHVWWFQATCPFVYAGNWFETESLTGGVITQVIEEADRDDDGIGYLYYIRVQGREIKMNGSDFWRYNVNDRVGILKVQDVPVVARQTSWIWTEQERIRIADIGLMFESDRYQIVPIDFYK